MNPNEKRNHISFLRGLAIFLMLWGHSIQCCCGNQFDFFNNVLFKVIYSFHMPLFMLISGYLFFYSEQKRVLIDLIEYKSKTLLYPILMCSIVNYLLTGGISAIIKGDFQAFLDAPSLTSLWFLWSVLACSIVLSFAVKLSKKILVQFVLTILGVVIVAVFPCGDMNIFMYPFFVVGYYYAKHRNHFIRIKNTIGVISIFVFVAMLLFFDKKHLIYVSGLWGGKLIFESLYIDFYRWVIGLFGSIAVAFVGTLIYRKFQNNKIAGYLENLGMDSLAVYSLSIPLLSIWLPKVINKLLSVLPWINWNNYIWLYGFVFTPLIAILYSIILLTIIKILKKYGIYRLLFGR